MELSIVIPAWNEAPSVGRVVEDVRRSAEAHAAKVEVLVVDDGSTDGTGDAARAAGARVIRNPSNAGYGSSLRRAIREASYDHVLITDGDGTYPAEAIPLLLERYNEGQDMVVGARRGKYYRGSLIKNPARILFRWLAEFVAGRPIPDINSGMRVMRRSEVLPHLPHTCLGFSFTTSLTLAMILSGNFVCYVPIEYRKRIGASKVRPVRDTLRAAQILLSTIVRYNPLKLFLLLAFIPWVFAAVSFALSGLSAATAVFASAGFVVFAIGLALEA